MTLKPPLALEVINPEAHSWSTEKIRDCGMLSPKWDICVISFPSHPTTLIQDHCAKEDRKVLRAGSMGD